MGIVRKTFNISVGRCEVQRPFTRFRCIREVNVKTILNKYGVRMRKGLICLRIELSGEFVNSGSKKD
jgi:hypothetical protein